MVETQRVTKEKCDDSNAIWLNKMRDPNTVKNLNYLLDQPCSTLVQGPPRQEG